MGDRLTLDTADERTEWLRERARYLSTCNVEDMRSEESCMRLAGVWADSAVQAYRERLPPARRKAPAVVPRDYITAREQLPRLVGAILNPNGEQEAYCLDSVGMMSSVEMAITEVERLRGPTEGASDAGDWTEEQISEVARQLVHQWGGVLGTGYGDLHARFCVHILDGLLVDSGRGRPPTGEASPDTDDAGVWEKRSRAYRKCADRFQAERDEVEDRLGTLIGAAEDEAGLLRDWAGVIGDRDASASAALTAIADRLDAAKGSTPAHPTQAERRGDGLADHWLKRARGYHDEVVRSDAKFAVLADAVRGVTEGPYLRLDEALERLRDALDAAKGDAPTATPSPTTPARAWTEEERTRAAWGDSLDLDPNGAPYTVELLVRETERLTAPSPTTPAPQVPDSPGWWWVKGVCGWQPVEVFMFTPPLQSGVLLIEQAHADDVPNGSVNPDDHEWDGRCTRGAPDDGLRARVEAVSRDCAANAKTGDAGVNSERVRVSNQLHAVLAET